MTPLQLAKRSHGRIGVSTAYRWQQLRGRVKTFDAEVLESLCDILGVDVTQVIERERSPRRR